MRSACASEKLTIGPDQTVTAHVYRGGASCRVLHLHGGAFAGHLSQGHPVALVLASAGATVFSIGYPCGAAHPFPEGLEAAYAALCAIAVRRQKLLVAGEEAGGNLAAALALVCRDRLAPKLAGQILFSPMLDPRLGTCSVRAVGAGADGCKWTQGWRNYLGRPEKASHPYAAPANALRLAGLAPALILTGPDDPMQDEAAAYAARLRASGVSTVEQRIAIDGPWPTSLEAANDDPPWAASVRDAVVAFVTKTI